MATAASRRDGATAPLCGFPHPERADWRERVEALRASGRHPTQLPFYEQLTLQCDLGCVVERWGTINGIGDVCWGPAVWEEWQSRLAAIIERALLTRERSLIQIAREV